MNRIIGGILTAGGLLGVIIFGYQYLQDSESFSVLGADIAASTGNITPVIISAIVMIAGIFIGRSRSL
ncbi:MAG: hypothetical protein WD625_05140 [Balneolales bacterium]